MHPVAGLQSYQCREIAFALGLKDKQVGQFTQLMSSLFHLFKARDLALVEINPWLSRRPASCWRSMPRSRWTTTRCFASRRLRNRTTRCNRTRRNTGRRVSGSITSRSTEISVAWSTAPGWRWRPWTLSSCTAVRRRIFSTSVAAPRPTRSPRRSRSSLSDASVKAILVNIFGGIVRCDLTRRGPYQGGAGNRCLNSRGGASRRHERRKGAGATKAKRSQDHRRRQPYRCGEAGRGGGGITVMSCVCFFFLFFVCFFNCFFLGGGRLQYLRCFSRPGPQVHVECSSHPTLVIQQEATPTFVPSRRSRRLGHALVCPAPGQKASQSPPEADGWYRSGSFLARSGTTRQPCRHYSCTGRYGSGVPRQVTPIYGGAQPAQTPPSAPRARSRERRGIGV